jgi:hypothetical protein
MLAAAGATPPAAVALIVSGSLLYSARWGQALLGCFAIHWATPLADPRFSSGSAAWLSQHGIREMERNNLPRVLATGLTAGTRAKANSPQARHVWPRRHRLASRSDDAAAGRKLAPRVKQTRPNGNVTAATGVPQVYLRCVSAWKKGAQRDAEGQRLIPLARYMFADQHR